MNVHIHNDTIKLIYFLYFIIKVQQTNPYNCKGEKEEQKRDLFTNNKIYTFAVQVLQFQ